MQKYQLLKIFCCGPVESYGIMKVRKHEQTDTDKTYTQSADIACQNKDVASKFAGEAALHIDFPVRKRKTYETETIDSSGMGLHPGSRPGDGLCGKQGMRIRDSGTDRKGSS